MINILVILLSLAPAFAKSACPEPDYTKMTSDTLEAAIKNPACDIKSISDLLKYLPEMAKTQYSLFYRSRSLQGPFKNDFKNPRAILKINENLIVSFNNDPKHSGSLGLEIVQMNTSGGKDDIEVFKYREFQFPFQDSEAAGKSWQEVQNGMHFSGTNPKKCATCHGDPARGIFPGYPDWEGSFGSFHTQNPPPKQDIEGYREFVKNLKSNPTSRYAMLSPPQNGTTDENSIYGYFDAMNEGINMSLGNANAVKTGRMFAKTKDQDKYRYAVLAAFLRCEDFESFFPDTVREGLLSNIESKFDLKKKWTAKRVDQVSREIYDNDRQFIFPHKAKFTGDDLTDYSDQRKRNYTDYKSRLDKYLGKSPAFKRLQLDTMSYQGPTRVDPLGTNLRMVMEGRGINIDSWFLDLTQPTYRFHAGSPTGIHAAREITKNDPQLRTELASLIRTDLLDDEEFNTRRMKGEDFLTLNKERNARAHIDEKKTCERLRTLSLKSLAGVKVQKLTPAQLQAADSESEAGLCCTPEAIKAKAHANYPHTFSKTCTACHEENDYSIGPAIPFSNPEKMKLWLATGNNASLLKNKILSTDEDGRMPPTRRLTDDEMDGVIKYLNNR